MAERKYSVAEIDRMRNALLMRAAPSAPASGVSHVTFGDPWKERERRETAVEDMLRTYMLGGVEPAELEEACKRSDSYMLGPY